MPITALAAVTTSWLALMAFAVAPPAPDFPENPSTLANGGFVEPGQPPKDMKDVPEGADIALLGYQSMDWPDGGLGCPEPGVMYPQVMMEGSRIRLSAKGRAWTYHAGGGAPFLCDKRRRFPPAK
jgi:hypothetical protein